MSAVVLEVIAWVLAVRTAVGSSAPAVRSAVSAAAAVLAAFARSARTAGASAAQAGQRLCDRFGGVRLCGLVRCGAHPLILHAT